jgi:hypothetical protein
MPNVREINVIRDNSCYRGRVYAPCGPSIPFYNPDTFINASRIQYVKSYICCVVNDFLALTQNSRSPFKLRPHDIRNNNIVR